MSRPRSPWVGESDPWDDAASTHARAGARLGALGAAWALGIAGTTTAVWSHGPAGRTGAVTLAVAAIALVALLEFRPRWWLPYLTLPLATALTAVATHATIGATPALIAAASTVLAQIAIRGGPPTPHPADATPAPLAIPLLAVAQLHWYRSTDPLTTALLLTAAATTIGLYHLIPAPLGRIDRTITRIAAAISAFALLLITLPTLYLAGVAVNLLDRLRLARPRGWRIRTVTPVDQRRRTHRRSATPEPHTRRRWIAVSLAIAALAAATFLATLRSEHPAAVARPITTATPPDDPEPKVGDLSGEDYELPSAIADADWADELLAESAGLSYPPSSAGGYRIEDRSGRWVNVVNGERRTLQPAPCDCDPLDIWLVGGGAAFGLGQRDDHTIASELVRAADAQGLHLHVRNLGVPGWTLWQEYQGILARLAAGETPPDLIIFYDGFNDMDKTLTQAIAYGPRLDRPVVFDQAGFDAAKVRRYTPDELEDAFRRIDLEELARGAAARFTALAAVIDAQLAATGIRSMFFFQPDASTSARQLEAGTESYTVVAPELVGPTLDMVATAKDQLGGRHRRLDTVLAGEPQPVFVDLINLNENGAAQIAKALLRAVADGPA